MTSALSLLILTAGSATCAPAAAQSMSPMRGEVTSFADAFAMRVHPANPYDHQIRVEVRVYDQDFAPVAAQVLPNAFMLGAQSSRSVLVVIPFEGSTTRKVRICTESVPFPRDQTRIKAQICGRFLARRL